MSASAIEAVLQGIAKKHHGEIDPHSKLYILIDLGRACHHAGNHDDAGLFYGINVAVPLLRQPPNLLPIAVVGGGMFLGRAQLSSGLIVPRVVVEHANMEFSDYTPHPRMMLLVEYNS